MPNGGLRMVENGLKAYGYKPDPFVTRVFGNYRKIHNDGVFDAYTSEMRAARKAGIVTGLPDAYGRGRIIDTYRKLTGGELAPTLSFATRLDRLGVPMRIRYVLVPGWTDDEEAVEGLARFVAGLGTVDRVDVLPFHKLGAAKYDALGLPFPLRDTPVPAPEPIERVRARFRAHGLSAY